MSARQEADTLAWDQSDDLWDEGVKKARLSSTCRKIEALAAKVLEKPATYFTPLVMGAFNILYPIRTESPDNSSEMNVLVRLPSVGRRVFPEEKTLAEAATALCTSQRTSLPVPEVINYDIDPDIGPFMIIQDLGSRRTLGAGLYHSSEELSMYRTDNSENKLKHLYEKMAPLVLQLAQPTFPVIGALLETSPGSFHVLARPISFNMSDMVLHSNVPKSIFPPQGTTFQTANEWYTALAEMHIATLLFQHNDMVESEDDCKTNPMALMALCQHQRVQGPFVFGPMTSGRRMSSLMKKITFSPLSTGNLPNVGPTQFALDPPWWLLIEKPEDWFEGIDDWASLYETRLPTWLSALEKAEQNLAPGAFLISEYMRESWATGRFWLNYAARKSYAFDAIYWKYLDERFFGKREGGDEIPDQELWKTRVHLLSQDELAAMEPLVRTKMEEAKEQVLVEWEAKEAQERLSSYLFD